MNGTSNRRAGAFWRARKRTGFWGGMMLIAALAAPGAAEASTYRWQVDASGDWNVPGNWEVVEGPAGTGYPNLAGDVAVIDVPFTAARTITIPDTVTITIGRLTATSSLSIARAGTGLLVFDNLGEDAVIESDPGRVTLTTPIQLAAHVTVDGIVDFNGISESVASRNVTITAGDVTFVEANSYTGTTTLVDGELSTSNTVLAVRIPGPLVVGDGTGAAQSARANLVGGATASATDVQVNADGSVVFLRNITFFFPHFTIGGLSISGGNVTIAGTGANVTVEDDLTMAGGEVFLNQATNGLQLTGDLIATSTAAGPAVIRSGTLNGIPGIFGLTAGAHDFTIADGPQAIDFETVVADIGGAASAALTKLGPGVMRVGRELVLTGGVSVMAGELILNGDASTSPFTIANTATLHGTGTAGPVTAQGGAVVSPGGGNAGTGILHSGAIVTDGILAIEINGSTPGAGYDQLDVTGTVELTGGGMVFSGKPFLPPAAVLTIIANDGSDPVTGTFAGLAEGDTLHFQGLTFAVSYVGGDGNDVVLANVTPITYLLSEGATGAFFDEDVLIANPNNAPAPITMTFLLPGGGPLVHHATVPAQSRLTVEVDQIAGLENTSASVQVLSDNRLTLAVERTMFWDSTHYGGHTANSVPRVENRWFFAEGAQNDFFSTYLLLANPNAQIVAKVTFLREGEPPFVLDVTLEPLSRTTVDASIYPALVGRSFGIVVESPAGITAERAMYFASTPTRLWSGGHDNVGSPEASTSWFHPEGASGTFFNTFILMSNPQSTPANVTLRFLLQSGDPIEISRTIQPMRRLTINPAAEGIVALQQASFSTVVTSDVPIVSERAMYWNTDDAVFGEGHASSGLTTTALDWSLAEGRVGGANAYTTYILLANPQPTAAEVKVTYLRESGTPVVKTYNVDPNSRFNIDVGGMVTELQNESFGALIEVTNNVPIAVERSMYWNVEGRFWSGGTNAVGAVVPR